MVYKKRENIIIFSDFFDFIKKNKKEQLNDLKKICFDFIKKKIDNHHTIIIPTFNFKYFESRKTNFSQANITTGFFNKAILEKFDFKRTFKPIYNYAIIGPNTEQLLNLAQTTAWGNDSVIGFLSMHRNTKAVGIGVNPKDFGWITIHACEEHMKVPYRYYKNFKGFNDDFKKNVEEKVYVKKLNFKKTVDQKIISEFLLKNKKIKTKMYYGIDFTFLCLNNYFEKGLDILKDDIFGLTV